MGERDFGGEARGRLKATVASMLAVLGSGTPGDPVTREAFVLGFHRAMCALFLTESRAMELGAIVVRGALLHSVPSCCTSFCFSGEFF